MDDSELQAIRAARLQEMQRNAQGGRGSANGGGEGDGSGANSGADKANAITESILSQILEPEAKERLNRVRMVKPERVLSVENYLVRLFQSGGIRSKVGGEDIVDILDKIAKEERKTNTTRIKFERREYADANVGGSKTTHGDDSDDDFFDE